MSGRPFVGARRAWNGVRAGIDLSVDAFPRVARDGHPDTLSLRFRLPLQFIQPLNRQVSELEPDPNRPPGVSNSMASSISCFRESTRRTTFLIDFFEPQQHRFGSNETDRPGRNHLNTDKRR